MAMGTLESTNNFMPFPCNLWLNRRQKGKRGLIAIDLSFLFFHLLVYSKAQKALLQRNTLWSILSYLPHKQVS